MPSNSKVLLLRLIVVVGAVASACGAITSWQEYQQLNRLQRDGRLTEATVEYIMSVSRGARRPNTCLNYSYTYAVSGRQCKGSIDDDAPEFESAFQKPRSPDSIGTLAITYLPDTPDVHAVGRVGDSHFRRANRYFWFLAFIALVCGVCAFLPSRYYGGTARP
jgi:hypothetical protein